MKLSPYSKGNRIYGTWERNGELMLHLQTHSVALLSYQTMANFHVTPSRRPLSRENKSKQVVYY
jgi:hypothetical protein